MNVAVEAFNNYTNNFMSKSSSQKQINSRPKSSFTHMNDQKTKDAILNSGEQFIENNPNAPMISMEAHNRIQSNINNF